MAVNGLEGSPDLVCMLLFFFRMLRNFLLKNHVRPQFKDDKLIMICSLSYHVWVVPVSRSSVGDDDVLVVSVVVDDGGHGAPRVLDVVEIAPDVARRRDGCVIRLQQQYRVSRQEGTFRHPVDFRETLLCPGLIQDWGQSGQDLVKFDF